LTLCSPQIPTLLLPSLHARFTTKLLAPKFPQHNWSYKFLGGVNATPREYTALWLREGPRCNALLGPGFSSLALGMSPIVNVPWLEWSATSTQLSDISTNPTFNRVIPTDVIGARMIVSLFAKLKWKTTGILCVDGAYGNSVTSGIVDAMNSIGGSVEYTRCVGSASTLDDMRKAMSVITGANSRNLVIAMNSNAAPFQHFKSLFFEYNLQNEVTLFFSESFCSKHVPDFFLFPGSFCATYSLNSTLDDAYNALFIGRNTSEDAADLVALGYDLNTVNLIGKDVFSAFAHDAVLHMMTAITTFPGSSSPSIYAHLRSITSHGLTGLISLSGADRVSADGKVLNVLSDGTVKNIGLVTGPNLTFSSSASQLLIRGDQHGLDNPPPELRRAISAASQDSIENLIVLFVVIVVLLVFGLLCYRLYRSKRFKRLVQSGIGMVALRVVILSGAIILYFFSAYTIIDANVQNSGVAAAHIILTIVGGFVTIVEIVTLSKYFALQISTSDVPDDVERWWQTLLTRIQLSSIVLKDLPQIGLSFAAVVQFRDSQFVVIFALCVACIFFGTKIMGAADKVLSLTKELLQKKERRFKTLRSVARYIVMANRTAGGPVPLRYDLTPSSSSSEVLVVRNSIKALDERRFLFFRGQVQKFVLMLRDNDMTQNEFIALVNHELVRRFVENYDGATDSFSTSVNPLGRPVAKATNATRKRSVHETIILEDAEE
jgi:hypothetical protein